jgi:NAD(P)-dependent dehydrogenase (short-subunit alcohol dehydrogenase family)
VDVDLLGVWRTVRAGLPQVVQRGGHVVVASVYAFMNGVLASPYAVAKEGVEQLGRALRVERERRLFRVHRHRHGPRRLLGSGREALRGAVPALHVPPSAAVRRGRGDRARHRAAVAADHRPALVRAFSALRGVLNPVFDRYLERDQETIDILREADVAERAIERTGGLPAP